MHRRYAPHNTHPQTWSARSAPPPQRRPRPLATLRAALLRLVSTETPSATPLDDVHTQSRLAALHRWLNLQAPLPAPARAALLLLMRPHAHIVRRSPPACLVCAAPLPPPLSPSVPSPYVPSPSGSQPHAHQSNHPLTPSHPVHGVPSSASSAPPTSPTLPPEKKPSRLRPLRLLRVVVFSFFYLLAAFVRFIGSWRRRLHRRAVLGRTRAALDRTLANPSCYSAWYAAAEHLDLLDGRAHLDPDSKPTGMLGGLCSQCHSVWNAKSLVRERRCARLHAAHSIDAVCDVDMIASKIRHLAHVYVRGDMRALAFALRDGLVRNIGGMCHPELHAHSRVGTNQIVEDYVNVVSYLLAYLAQPHAQLPSSPSIAKESSEQLGPNTDSYVQNVRGALNAYYCTSNNSSPIGSPGRHNSERSDLSKRTLSIDDKLTFLNEARHAHGRTAVMLSGGAAMGLNHLGVVKSLLYQGLLPKVVCGTSAGALVASIVGIYRDTELTDILDSGQLINPITGQPFSFRYFDDRVSVWRRFRRFLKKGFIQDVKMLQDCLRKEYGDLTFEEAYKKTRRILNITVCAVRSTTDPPLLLNYLTAPHVLIWSAASASCALPLVFAPVELVAKSASGRLVPYHPDGVRWIDGSISSDVPLSRIGELFNVNHFIVSQTNPHVIPRSMPILQSKVALLLKSEVQFRYWQALQMGLVPRLLTSIFPHFMQPYAGDVTIMPDVRLTDLMRLLQNPTLETVLGCIRRGEISTYPFLDRIRLHCQIEQTLDAAVEHVAKTERGSVTRQPFSESRGNSLFGRVPSWLWLDTRSILKGGANSPATSRFGPSRDSNDDDLAPNEASQDIGIMSPKAEVSESSLSPRNLELPSQVYRSPLASMRSGQSLPTGAEEAKPPLQTCRELDEILDELSYDSVPQGKGTESSKGNVKRFAESDEESGEEEEEEEERVMC